MGRGGSRFGPRRVLHVGRRKNKQDRKTRCKLVQVGVQMGDASDFRVFFESEPSQVIYCLTHLLSHCSSGRYRTKNLRRRMVAIRRLFILRSDARVAKNIFSRSRPHFL